MSKGEESEWSKLVGMTGEEAKDQILKKSPDLNVEVIPDGSMVTMDFRTDRVRVFVDSDGKVTQTPMIG